MGALPKSEPQRILTGIAEICVINGRQVVMLPENMHVDEPRLEIVQQGANFSLSPARKTMTKGAYDQLFADLDAFQRELGDFMPEGREQPPMPNGNDIEL